MTYQQMLNLYTHLTRTNAPADLIAPLEDDILRIELGDDYEEEAELLLDFELGE